jgi:hypothetical protein
MGRKLTVFLVAMTFAVAFAASAVVAGDAPDQIVIDKAANKKSGVALDHEKHSETIDCLKCHHKAASKDAVDKGCFDCHGVDSAANDPASGKKDNPFHIQCKECHKEKGEGPTKCKECHK